MILAAPAATAAAAMSASGAWSCAASVRLAAAAASATSSVMASTWHELKRSRRNSCHSFGAEPLVRGQFDRQRHEIAFEDARVALVTRLVEISSA